MKRRVFLFGVVGGSFIAGVFTGARYSGARPVPAAVPMCCAEERAPVHDTDDALVARLRAVVGAEHVLLPGHPSFARHLAPMRTAAPEDAAAAAAAAVVVAPGTLAEAVSVVEACAAEKVPLFPQGANTGLTGGSVGRDARGVVLDMRRLNRIQALDEGKLVLTFAGVGIHDLSTHLVKNHNRDSHTALGSSFLNPTVGAGIALGSGGVLMRKG